jgi:hypothetical protein
LNRTNTTPSPVRWAIASLLFATAFLPAPLAVLWDMNDECLRSTSWGVQRESWATLARIPPLPVAKNDYLLLRTLVIGAMASAVFLIIAGIVLMRSRPKGAALHLCWAIIQAALMILLIAAGRRFSLALDDAGHRRDWLMHLDLPSNVRSTALFVGMLGLIYPICMLIVYLLRSATRSKTRLPAR